ncbi:hypothetical protein X943_000109 [Babesia divergens]|uniref:Uncharacterized protein n=1 Tax=Babesia divergens TaxID=32595 RepID=A0AAD9LHH9_BABDI|nr:hypothetical protein X943_000109 [Babesia divergens]
MKTPTRRNQFASNGVIPDITHATESHSLSRPSRSFNPFLKGAAAEDEPPRRIGAVPAGSELFVSPPSRHKRTLSNDMECNGSLSMLKRIRSHRSTPIMNGGLYNDVSMISGEGTWKHRSSLLSKLGEHQQKADRILFDVSLLLRDVDKCNNLLRDLCISL